MNHYNFLKSQNFRIQRADEIIMDIDDRTERGSECLMETGIKLVQNGYHIEIWYAEGQKQPHIHIKKVIGLDSLTKKEGTEYRKLFFEKYISEEYWNDKIPDYSISESYVEGYHPIAEENKLHFKYQTPKLLRSEFNVGEVNQIEIELFDKVKEGKQEVIVNGDVKKEKYNLTEFRETLSGKISQHISILSIADKFGLEPMGKKNRVCCFHSDSNPSLSLNDDLGLFNCFGCNESGNIIKFLTLLKQLKPEFSIK